MIGLPTAWPGGVLIRRVQGGAKADARAGDCVSRRTEKARRDPIVAFRLPQEFEHLAALVDQQPSEVREASHFYLALAIWEWMMSETLCRGLAIRSTHLTHQEGEVRYA